MSRQYDDGAGKAAQPLPAEPPVASEQATLGHEHQTRHRVLRVRIVDVETGRLKVGLTLSAGLVGVATRLGARLVPPVPHAASMLAAIERGELSEPMVIDDARNGERVEISLQG
jgi:hypothetical protein